MISPWWRHPLLLHRFLDGLLRAEMARLRPGGWAAKLDLWAPGRHWVHDLDADSLELMALAGALGAAVDLPDADAADALFENPTPGHWARVAADCLDRQPDRMRYRSSGSTGTPRWHAHRLADLAQEMQVVGAVLGPVQRIVSAVPCHHIYGHLFGVLLPWARDLPDLPFLSLHGRAPLALGGQLRPGDLVLGFPDWWELVIAQEVTWPAGVTGVTSTAPCPDRLAQALTRQGLPRLVQVYGSSETAGVGWRDQPDQPFRLHPFWHRDASHPHRLLRQHASGDESPAAAPDVLRWTDDRHFWPGERRDGAVQVGGVNVFPGAVRALLRGHPAVKDVAVRLHDFSGQPRLKAYVVPWPEADPGTLAEHLRQWAAERLPAAARPAHVAVGLALPVNAEGKACDWPLPAMG